MAARRQPRRATKERHERLLTLVRSGRTHVEELADQLGVSTATIRRDLARLSEEGSLHRVYGGAVIGGSFSERALTERTEVRKAAKAAIGLAAADLVPDGGTIFLDAGSTCAQLAEQLRHREGLTVLTRGLEIALLLASEPALEVVMIGGVVAPKSHGLIGPLTTLALQRFVVDIAFLGVDAVDPVDGVGEPTLVEAQVKEIAAQRSRQVAVLADATKLERGGVPAWAPLGDHWILVTDERDGEVLDRYRGHGVDVITAPVIAEDAGVDP